MPLSTPVIIFRLVSAVLLIALAEFCTYGFLTSLEPGDHLPFQIAYPILGLSFFAAAMWLAFGAFRLQRSVLIRGLVGLCLGALIAFFLLLILFMVGPRGDFTRPFLGTGYALLGTPLGAAIGGMLGVWMGPRRPNTGDDGFTQ